MAVLENEMGFTFIIYVSICPFGQDQFRSTKSFSVHLMYMSWFQAYCLLVFRMER